MTAPTVSDAIARAVADLRRAGARTAEADAVALSAAALDLDIASLVDAADLPLLPSAELRITRALHRRLAGEPLPAIVRSCRFRGIVLLVDDLVPVPLPHTTHLVDLAHTAPPRVRVHIVASGTGALPLAVKRERPDLLVTASDAAPLAVAAARANARRLGLDVEITLHPSLPPGPHDLVLAPLADLGIPAPSERAAPAHPATPPNPELPAPLAFLRRVPPGTLVAVQHPPSATEPIRHRLRDAVTVGIPGRHARVTVGRTLDTPSDLDTPGSPLIHSP